MTTAATAQARKNAALDGMDDHRDYTSLTHDDKMFIVDEVDKAARTAVPDLVGQ